MPRACCRLDHCLQPPSPCTLFFQVLLPNDDPAASIRVLFSDLIVFLKDEKRRQAHKDKVVARLEAQLDTAEKNLSIVNDTKLRNEQEMLVNFVRLLNEKKAEIERLRASEAQLKQKLEQQTAEALAAIEKARKEAPSKAGAGAGAGAGAAAAAAAAAKRRRADDVASNSSDEDGDHGTDDDVPVTDDDDNEDNDDDDVEGTGAGAGAALGSLAVVYSAAAVTLFTFPYPFPLRFPAGQVSMPLDSLAPGSLGQGRRVSRSMRPGTASVPQGSAAAAAAANKRTRDMFPSNVATVGSTVAAAASPEPDASKWAARRSRRAAKPASGAGVGAGAAAAARPSVDLDFDDDDFVAHAPATRALGRQTSDSQSQRTVPSAAAPRTIARDETESLA